MYLVSILRWKYLILSFVSEIFIVAFVQYVCLQCYMCFIYPRQCINISFSPWFCIKVKMWKFRYLHMKSSFLKRVKRQSKDWVYNPNAQFGDDVLEKSSSEICAYTHTWKALFPKKCQTSNLEVRVSIPHAIHHLFQFGFPQLSINYSIIKGQLFSYHVYMMW